MKENRLKEIAKELESMKSLFDKMPAMVKEAIGEIPEEHREEVEQFSKAASQISNSKHLDIGTKLQKLNELRKQYGNSNNSK